MPPPDRPHRHQTPLRGIGVTPHPSANNPDYTAVHYAYAEQSGNIHEVVTVAGRQLAKVGFPDKKIVYYFLEDLEQHETKKRRTFHDAASETSEGSN